MKSKTGRAKLILIAAYAALWAFSVFTFWCLISGADAMGYAFLFVYGLLPLSTFVVSLLIGMGDLWGRRKWIAPLLFGLMQMLLPYVTFSLANTISAGNLHLPEPVMLLFGGAVSIIGLGLGVIIYRVKSSFKK